MKAIPNGETKERAVVVFGASIEEVCDIPYLRFCFSCSLNISDWMFCCILQLLNTCTARLDLSSAARRLFQLDGDEVCRRVLLFSPFIHPL